MGTADRNFGLDVLRVIAIALVLANHGFLSFYRDLGVVAWGKAGQAFSVFAILSIEWLFVLSGFLIGTILIRTLSAPGRLWRQTGQFWVRRWLRTVPNYMLFVGVNVLLVTTGVAQGAYSWKFVAFAQNLWSPMKEPYFFVESWSLALDEWFYLVLPAFIAFVLLLKARLRGAFVASALALIVAPLLLRLLAEPGTDLYDWDRRFRVVTLYHLDATGWGVLAAGVNRWWPKSWAENTGVKAIAGLALMLAGLVWLEAWLLNLELTNSHPRLTTALPLTLIGGGTALAVPWLCKRRPVRGTVGAIITRISLYSYSIYLVHLPLMYVLRDALGDDAPAFGRVTAQAVVWLFGTLAISAGLFHGFEKPIFDLRERFTTKVDARPFAKQDEPKSAATPDGA